MPAAFHYRPRFVDIRVRPPTDDEEAAEDVNALKAGERPCDRAGCRAAASARAPKARNMPGDWYWFCEPHAGEYNKSWNWYAGMSEGEIRAAREEELTTGGRPTWAFMASNRSREAAAAARPDAAEGPAWFDPLGLFGGGRRRVSEPAPQDARRLGKLERQALADLELDDRAEPATVRRAYTDLIKRFHPDTNGGDRGAEARLQRVIKAYQALKKAGLA